MIGTFKFDRSFFGHALEALLISLVVMGVCALAAQAGVASIDLWDGYLLGGAFALAYYIGREKRDCETGLKLPAGSPKAWLLMWVRWNNLLDVAGPIIVYVAAWAVYLLR